MWLSSRKIYENIIGGNDYIISEHTPGYISSDSKQSNSETSGLQNINRVAILTKENGEYTYDKERDYNETEIKGRSIDDLIRKSGLTYNDDFKVMTHIKSPNYVGWIEVTIRNFNDLSRQLEENNAHKKL